MKAESEGTPQSVSQTPTPTAYTPTQWAATNSQIPIDPALQQQSQHATTTPYQHYQAYTSHYSQASYAHYQPYSAAVTPHAPVAQTQAPAAQRQTAAAQSSSSGMDTSDIATLNDALGSAGVDLRAEEETLQRSHEQSSSYRSFEDRTRKQPPTPSFDTRFLGTTMRTIGTQHKVTRIPDDAVNYLALALRARLQDLVTAMITAAHHRTDTQFDGPASLYEDGSPMWSIVIRSDVTKQLAALEKVEREDELRIRRERKERLDMAAAHAAALAAQANGLTNPMAVDDDLDGGAKKKRKKDGPGVTARNMSEDVRKKMSNAVATQAAGLGGKYAWMTASNASTPAKPKPTAATGATTAGGIATTSATTTTPASGTGGTAGSWARPYVPAKKPTTPSQATPEEEDTRILINMRDAMFVIEKERGHGGGKGAARGWV